MTIYNKDGSVFKPLGSLKQIETNSPSHELFNQYDQELIKIGGSPIYYYEVFIPSSSFDDTYVESRSKLFSQHPVQLYSVYEPAGSSQEQGLFGVDGPDTVTFYCNYRAVIDALGHLPVVGSRIYTPHLGEHWEILTRKLADFYRYKVYHLEINCIRFQESLTNNDGKVTDAPSNKPTFDID